MSVSTRALSSARRRFTSIFKKSFSCQVQQKVFLTLVSDVFLNLSFDLPVLSPLFAYLNKLDRPPSITLWYSFVSILKRQVVLCSFALKSPLFCLQILIRCSQKETVWHWRARHQQKVYTISKLKLGVSILKPPWKYCICVTISVRGIILP